MPELQRKGKRVGLHSAVFPKVGLQTQVLPTACTGKSLANCESQVKAVVSAFLLPVTCCLSFLYALKSLFELRDQGSFARLETFAAHDAPEKITVRPLVR